MPLGQKGAGLWHQWPDVRYGSLQFLHFWLNNFDIYFDFAFGFADKFGFGFDFDFDIDIDIDRTQMHILKQTDAGEILTWWHVLVLRRSYVQWALVLGYQADLWPCLQAEERDSHNQSANHLWYWALRKTSGIRSVGILPNNWHRPLWKHAINSPQCLNLEWLALLLEIYSYLKIAS